jgi:hypothetical protein
LVAGFRGYGVHIKSNNRAAGKLSYTKGDLILCHFRPYCVRRVLPNATITVKFDSNSEVTKEHQSVAEYLANLQKRYPVNYDVPC